MSLTTLRTRQALCFLCSQTFINIFVFYRLFFGSPLHLFSKTESAATQFSPMMRSNSAMELKAPRHGESNTLNNAPATHTLANVIIFDNTRGCAGTCPAAASFRLLCFDTRVKVSLTLSYWNSTVTLVRLGLLSCFIYMEVCFATRL